MVVISDSHSAYGASKADSSLQIQQPQTNKECHMCSSYIYEGSIRIDRFNYRAWHYKNYHVPKIGSHFVEGKRERGGYLAGHRLRGDYYSTERYGTERLVP